MYRKLCPGLDLCKHLSLVVLTLQADVDRYRKAKTIFVKGHRVPKPLQAFEEACFPSYLHNVLIKQGFVEPTPIQAQGWPMALSGRDFVGIAQTGSGKTIGVSCLSSLAMPVALGPFIYQ